jgi:hypothetical protein
MPLSIGVAPAFDAIRVYHLLLVSLSIFATR